MRKIGESEYGVTEYAYTYKKVAIMASYLKIIEVPVDEDFDSVIDDAFENIDLSDLDYDYEVLGEKTENVWVRE